MSTTSSTRTHGGESRGEGKEENGGRCGREGGRERVMHFSNSKVWRESARPGWSLALALAFAFAFA